MKTTFEATPNYSKRTFTVREKLNGKTIAKFKTVRLPKEEFNEMLRDTSEDWLYTCVLYPRTYMDWVERY